MTYDEIIEYILEVPKFTKKNSLEHTAEMLAALGHPERKMKVAHVAGTNGKGSVCSYISSVLVTSGRKTGLFSSPHLVKLNERFRIQNQPVKDSLVTAAFLKVKAVIDQMTEQGKAHPTFFELLFLMAVVIFEKEEVEYAILETGMGGRFDATNAVAQPAVTVITSIGLDHTEILGETIAAVAAEKAGIIKPGVPVIYDGRQRQAAAVIEAKCEEHSADAYPLVSDMYEIFINEDKNVDFTLKSRYSEYNHFRLQSRAGYQAVNAALALLTLEVLGGLQEPELRRGLEQMVWPGRAEEVLPDVYLDGAHNIDGARELGSMIRDMGGEKRYLLFAVTREKNYHEMIRILCQDITYDGIVLTEVEGDRKVPVSELKSIFEKYVDCPVITLESNENSFRKALQIKEKNAILFVAGSLYLIGNVKKMIEEKRYD